MAGWRLPTQDRTDGDGHDIGQQMLPSLQGTGFGQRLEMGAQPEQLRRRLCHFSASMQSMRRAGSHAGPRQIEELISNSNRLAPPIAPTCSGYKSSRALALPGIRTRRLCFGRQFTPPADRQNSWTTLQHSFVGSVNPRKCQLSVG